MTTIHRVAAALIAATLAAPQTHALNINDVVRFRAPIPSCLDLDDTKEVRRIQAATQSSYGERTLYGRALTDLYMTDQSRDPCHWIGRGETRYVAKKIQAHLSDGVIPSAAYFCLGELIDNTNRRDETRPCVWVFMQDK